MIELVEFRIPEANARNHLPPGAGVLINGSVRKLVVDTKSELFEEIGILDLRFKSQGAAFYTACSIKRNYSRNEIESAPLLHLKISKVFEPSGEEFGTVYDESAACKTCGAGALQASKLILPEKKIPKSKDFCRTIAGELVVSRRAFETLQHANVAGADFSTIVKSSRTGELSESWFQLFPNSPGLEIISPTRIGIDPFDADAEGRFRCQCGNLIGLNLLSEITVKASRHPFRDIQFSQQFVGVRRGYLRPEKVLFVSQRFRSAIELGKITGVEFEVAHIAD